MERGSTGAGGLGGSEDRGIGRSGDRETRGREDGGTAARQPDTTAAPLHRRTAALAYVALGANLGDRVGQLRAAVDALDARPDVAVTARSPVYEAEAHTLAGEAQPAYLNAVVAVRTALGPAALLDALLAVERDAGRVRDRRWAPRTLDLDLVLYGDEALQTRRLTVPHPRLAARRFVLQPLADLAPDHVVPGLGATVADLLAACPDRAALRRTDLAL